MASDNICKYLAEEYPEQFVRWLLSSDTQDIQVLKTELSLEPIRADSLTLLRTANRILHIEFQTLPPSHPPLPLRMLDYWVRLHRQYGCPVEQVVIFLKYTTSEAAFVDQFEAPNTRHRYRVIRLWEQDPAPLLEHPALLPLAALARSNSPTELLGQIAVRVARIEETQERQNVAACVDVLAGLRFEPDLIRRFFPKEIMRESLTYQEILQEGRQEGRQEGEVALLIRQLTRRFGQLDLAVQEQIRSLAIPQLEELGEAMLDFEDLTNLTAWLEQHRA